MESAQLDQKRIGRDPPPREPGTEAQPITIRGIAIGGSRPVLSGGTNTVTFQTLWPYSPPDADHHVAEGFEVTGSSTRCIFHQAGDLVVRDTAVRGCPDHGILGAGRSGRARAVRARKSNNLISNLEKY